MRFRFQKYRGRYEFVRSALAPLRGTPFSFLDIGNLGDGASSFHRLKGQVEAWGGTYTGLDSNEPLTRALRLPSQVIGDVHAVPFPDAHFDALYAGEIIEHTWTPAVMVRECYRILKPGGLLILDTPNPYAITTILSFLLLRRNSMGDNRRLTYEETHDGLTKLKHSGQVLMQPQHKIFFTPAMMRQILETQGFVLESIGCTQKPRNVLHWLLLKLFPHTGPHLCCIARKATIEEAFQDVAR